MDAVLVNIVIQSDYSAAKVIDILGSVIVCIGYIV